MKKTILIIAALIPFLTRPVLAQDAAGAASVFTSPLTLLYTIIVLIGIYALQSSWFMPLHYRHGFHSRLTNLETPPLRFGRVAPH